MEAGERGVVCPVTRTDGTPCRAKAGPSGYCFGHDPTLKGKHEQGCSAGGKGRAMAVRVSKLFSGNAQMGDVFEVMKSALGETYNGTLDPRTADGLAALSNALVRLYEIGELEQRLTALE